MYLRKYKTFEFLRKSGTFIKVLRKSGTFIKLLRLFKEIWNIHQAFRVTHHRAGMLGNLKMTLECTQAHERHVHYRFPFAVFLRLFKGF